MGMGLTDRRAPGGLGFALLLLALVGKLILPPGIMPGAAPGLPLVLCTGQGPVTTEVPDQAPTHDRRQGGMDAPCPFAGHALWSSVPELAPQPTRLVAYAEPVADLLPPQIGAPALAAPPPPPHAPPALD